MITLSKSRLNSFITCPEKYRISYDLNIRPLKTAPSLIEGSAIHHLVESALVYGKHIDTEDVLELASESFWKDNPFDICAYASFAEYQQAQIHCLLQAKKFIELIGNLNIVSMEEYFYAPLVDPVTREIIAGIELNGYVDLIDEYNGQHRIIDLKTIGKTPREGVAGVALELTFYAYLFGYPFLDYDESIPVAFLNLIRTKEPKIVWDVSNRSMNDFMELVFTCKNIASNILERRYWKNTGMHCSWCDYNCLCWSQIETAKELFGNASVDYYLTEKELYIPTMQKEVSYAI